MLQKKLIYENTVCCRGPTVPSGLPAPVQATTPSRPTDAPDPPLVVPNGPHRLAGGAVTPNGAHMVSVNTGSGSTRDPVSSVLIDEYSSDDNVDAEDSEDDDDSVENESSGPDSEDGLTGAVDAVSTLLSSMRRGNPSTTNEDYSAPSALSNEIETPVHESEPFAVAPPTSPPAFSPPPTMASPSLTIRSTRRKVQELDIGTEELSERERSTAAVSKMFIILVAYDININFKTGVSRKVSIPGERAQKTTISAQLIAAKLKDFS